MPLANDDPFVGRQFFQRHRPAGVQLLRADGNFRTQSQRAAIGKTGAGVQVNRCRVHFVQKAVGVIHIPRQDAI